jgi:sec-independent protein translocase protein TatC
MIRISGVLSFLSILPLILYHLWSFFIPSCYNFERKIINTLVCSFLLLFVLELLVIYFFIFPKICEFLMSFEIKSLENISLGENLTVLSVELSPRIQSYLKLIYRFFFLILGIFQLPFVFIVFYSKKWINFSYLCEKRKYVFFFCILVSAFISPPDFVSQSILCFFSYIIYEFIIFLGLFYESDLP